MSFILASAQYIIRKAFDCSPDGKKYLPDSILWRQKEQFSDGVGYDHINSLKDAAERSVSDEAFAKRSERWPEDKGCTTKEAYYYRDIFECESELLKSMCFGHGAARLILLMSLLM